MSIPDVVWAAYRREQQRLRQLEALRKVVLAQGSTAFLRTESRVKVMKRRLRRLELLLARVYRRLSRKAVAA